jgi:hypothetical protein
MTVPTQENQVQDTQPSNKELNFRALEQKYQQQLAAQQAETQRLQNELQNRQQPIHDEDDDSEPYVDHKRLRKEQAKFGQQIKQETQSEIQKAVHMALNEERKKNWMTSNPDFQDVMQHAERFAQHDPELAETILTMPEGFERTKLVYKNIKALGLHRPQEKQPSIQDKIDANRRSPYYQPNSVGSAPYSNVGDYSKNGQKQAYDKMQELKNNLRL